jgi:hypothetical protein
MAVSGTTFSTSPSSALDLYTAQAQDSRRNTPEQAPQGGSNGDSAPTQISSFAVVRYNLDEVRAQAQAVQNSSKSPDSSSFKAAVQGVVNSVNSLREAASSANGDQRAQQVLTQVDNAVADAGKANPSVLQNAGIQRQDNGNLQLDQRRLEESLDRNREDTVNAVNDLVSRLDKVVSQPLSGSAGATAVQNRSSQPTEAERSEAARAEARDQARRQLVAQQAAASTYSAHSAVTTYFNVSSF